MKLLLVSNQPDTATLFDALIHGGIRVDVEQDFQLAASRAESTDFQLVIIDAVGNTIPLFAVVHKIRTTSAVPVLVITDVEDWESRVLAFQAGADDCLSKPFRNEELIARIGAITRRSAVSAPQPLFVGRLRFCPASRNAWYGEQAITFTSMECVIVEVLMRACGRVVSRDQISLQLYGRLTTAFDRSVDTHVSRIRRKLGEGGKFIISVRGTGYLLSLARPADSDSPDWEARTVNDAGTREPRHTS
jgi:two-component system response regulator CpxR